MFENFLYVLGILLLAAVAYFLFASTRTYKKARNQQLLIDWALIQLERALDQTRSNNAAEVVAGIQCLSMLNVPEIRLKAIDRLTELRAHANTMVAKQAEAAILRLTRMDRVSGSGGYKT